MKAQPTRRDFLKLGAASLTGASLAAVGLWSKRAEGQTTSPGTSTGRLVHGAFDGNCQWGDTTRIDNYSALVGDVPQVVNVFQAWKWDGSYVDFPSGYTKLASKYPLVMMTWEPRSSGNTSGETNRVTLDTILAGKHDAYVRSMARKVKGFGKRLLIRLGHEMNGDWYPYGTQSDPVKAEKFRKMFRRVHRIFEVEGAANVEWVFCPMRRWSSNSLPFSAYYPGDAYVDWLGLDGYNWAGARNTPWRSFEEIFKPSMIEMSELCASKFVIICEYGSDDRGGDKGAWFAGVLPTCKTAAFSHLKALLYFNNNQDGANWRVNYPYSALDDYRALVKDPYLQTSMPAAG